MDDVDCNFRRSDFAAMPLKHKSCSNRRSRLTPILVGGAIGLAGHVYGLIDAGPSVRRMHARNGFGIATIDMKPTVALDGAMGAQFTLRLASNQ
jgi:hypothetical protein